MELKIDVHLVYGTWEPTDLLVQIEVAELADQRVLWTSLSTLPDIERAPAGVEAELCPRFWVRSHGRFACDYGVHVKVERAVVEMEALRGVSPRQLPGDVVRYLMPSRFCPSDRFEPFVEAEFGHLQGGARIAAMRDWIEASIAYVPGASTGQTTALDTFVQRQGVCRDFSHMMITLARASGIPARFASVYSPGVTPQDFHAVAEVYLGGGWHLVDATGMATADTIARIGVGMDAAELAFLTAFGGVELYEQWVSVEVVTPEAA